MGRILYRAVHALHHPGFSYKRKLTLLILLGFLLSGCAVKLEKGGKLTPPVKSSLKQAKQAIIRGDCKKALAILKPLLGEEVFKVYLYHGVAEIMCEDYPAAYRSLQKALGYAPDQIWTSRVYAMNGFIFYLIDKRKEAGFYFKLSLEAHPHNELALEFKQRKLNKQIGIKTIIEWLK